MPEFQVRSAFPGSSVQMLQNFLKTQAVNLQLHIFGAKSNLKVISPSSYYFFSVETTLSAHTQQTIQPNIHGSFHVISRHHLSWHFSLDSCWANFSQPSSSSLLSTRKWDHLPVLLPPVLCLRCESTKKASAWLYTGAFMLQDQNSVLPIYSVLQTPIFIVDSTLFYKLLV